MAIACILGHALLWPADLLSETRHGMNVGLGISTSLNGSCTFTMEHPFAERWAISASAGIRIRELKVSSLDETLTHNKEFEDASARPSGSSHRETFSFSYWPQKVNKGPSVYIGAEYIGNEGADAICGISYRIPIWKGLSADISWQTGCIRPIIYGTKSIGSAGLNFYYRF